MRDLRHALVLTAVLATVAPAAAGPAAAAALQQPSQAQSAESLVVTSGEGVVQATPDRAWITISAESRASSPREAQRRNAEAMRPVQEALRGARVPADAIRTVGYDLQQEFDFVGNRRVSKGYLARNSIEVRVDDVTRVGELLELSVSQGATAVSGLRFDLKEQGQLERDALRAAVSNARLKAEAAAAGAGRTVDRVVRIDEGGTSAPPPPMPFVRALKAGAADDAPPVSAGQIEVRAQVTVTWALK